MATLGNHRTKGFVRGLEHNLHLPPLILHE